MIATYRIRRVALATALLGAAWMIQSCAESPAAPMPDPVAAIAVSAPSDTILVGDVMRAGAVATCAHGHVLTRDIAWSTSDPSVAAIDDAGMLTALAPGQIDIVATAEGIRGLAPVTVLVPAASIYASLVTDTLLPGEEIRVTAIVTDAEGNALDRTVHWSVADPTIATVTPAGLVHAVTVGATTVHATYMDLTASVQFLVRAPVGSVLVTPVTASLIIPNTLQLAATVRDPMGNPIERDVIWTSADPAIAVVDATGLVTPVARGTASITAYAEGKTATASIVVKPAVDAVTVEPSVASVDVNESLALGAVLLDADGNALNRPVAWATSDPAIATVATTGMVTGVAPGIATVTATIEGKTSTATITVLVPVASLEIASAPALLDIGQSAQLAATPRDASGNGLARPVTWTSSNPSVASVDASGFLRAVGEGSATISATARGVSESVTITVLVPVATVTLDPPTGIIAPGATLRLVAAVKDASGGLLTRDVTWTTSNAAIATVDDAGVLTGVTPGTVVLTATARGKSGQGTYTVQVPVVRVDLTPTEAAISVGGTVQLTATPRDAGGVALARPVEWTSSNLAVASVGSTGMVQGTAVGIVTISAASEGHFGAATITVRVPVAAVQVIAPGGEPLSVGGSTQLAATVLDAQGGPLTDRTVTWASADDAIATVDDAGLVTATGRGTVTIFATSEGITGSADIRVVGEETGVLGNNLSYPVIFSEGIGISGLLVSDDAGLRPTAAEGITADTLPFFAGTNVPDYDAYYMQQGTNVWQAAWIDGAQGAIHGAEVAWGDNLTHQTWTTHSPIRVEVTLYAYQYAPLKGFNMSVLYGSGTTEMQGTDGTTSAMIPTIYAVTPRLIIQKLDDVTREPVYTLFDGTVYEGLGGDGPGSFGAEVNVSGKVVYGYNLMLQDAAVPADLHKYGWWRITFALDDHGIVGGVDAPRHTALDRLVAPSEALTYTPQIDPTQNRSWIDINVVSARGGGGGE
ncbi:MAG TPA: Ig-like domain-containing protein [Gemmatimonadales bacterium]|nr:Ig-like domain-containing protein [Gemmatimonadales bacterium]